MDKNIQQYCVSTLSEIWAQIDWDKVKGSRALGIWDEFTAKVKSTAMTTTSYETFVEKLCRKMDVRSLRFAMISEISELSEDIKKQILKCFRSETQIIILKLRLQNQIRKEQMQREKEAAANKED
ncbi:hypothetical protein [Romboutsia timonensis]|jgi:hypothetical protein|uniref:hypothetical protein n=1 Tax=Romboutsia timonensis TaxID=1776391 RepID=UPI002049F7F5|nr:hypothetical protein [Clostridium sp.]MDU6533877.1 hypothetical protein [Intestinibacter bartlettii]UVX98833.1 MAG: hypothetical protein [Bacteriophage sp.]DAO12930.1 MAG TPA: hypothetical protein [Caudoviricetes sp.]